MLLFTIAHFAQLCAWTLQHLLCLFQVVSAATAAARLRMAPPHGRWLPRLADGYAGPAPAAEERAALDVLREGGADPSGLMMGSGRVDIRSSMPSALQRVMADNGPSGQRCGCRRRRWRLRKRGFRFTYPGISQCLPWSIALPSAARSSTL